jgi:branched-subunit amino acid aminotransferase/4-amino-4-deoxychorismate lyase
MHPYAGCVFLNGRIVKAARANVSVFDRGLLYGDGLFETIRTYRGVPFALGEHIERLGSSARALGFRLPDYDWADVIGRLLEHNYLTSSDAAVRITVTRGPAEPSLLPPESPRPTTIATARPVDPVFARRQRRGISVTVLPFARGGSFTEHKLLDYVSAIVGRTVALQRGCEEGIYADPDGRLREAVTASLFIVRGQSLLTTPVEGILPGVTRRFVLELVERAGIRVVEAALHRCDLLRAAEIFLTSSVAEIMPVVRVDERPVGSGRPGILTRRIQRLYRSEVGRRCSRDRKGPRSTAAGNQ